MRIERTKNAARNIVFGIALKMFQILIPFLMRTAMIYFMGVEYLGLSSLFTSVLQVLNLAELGVGSAMVFSMYKPIAEDDCVAICALMRLYRLYYRVIGGAIAAVGIILTPFIPYLIKSDLPAQLNVYILYLLSLGATVLSYWLFAYKNSLFSAHQRTDMTSKITLVTNTFQYAVQFIIIIFIKDYYLYVIIALFTQVLTNVLTAIAATKMYPDYNPCGHLDKKAIYDINHRIRDLFTSKIGAVVIGSADTLVISAFLGLTVLAVYQNYYYLITAVTGLLTVVFSACTAGIGNSVIVETSEKNFSDLKKFTFLICWITGFCTCCFLCLYQPFMRIWVGDELMLKYSSVVCFSIYFFVFEINQLLNTYKDAAGIWHEDRFRPLVTALSNLCMNLIMVQFWGIYGVILSTVLSMLLVGMPWLLHNLFTVLFDKSLLAGYLKQLVSHVTVVFISCISCCFICSFVDLSKWGTLVINAIICCIVPNLIYFFVYRKTEEYKSCLQLIDKMTHGKFKLEIRLVKRG